jgi:hypothetical protein|nr:MAG TPA: hypothetical protein [Caudoviricetes sp.]
MDYVMIGPYQFDRDASKDDMRLDYCSSFQEVALDESSLSFDTVSVEVCTTTIGAQLSALPNNTPIIVYRDGEIKARFVSSGVSRIGPVTYQLKGRSPMGALTGMVHAGGIYTGQTVEEVVKEICGNIPSLIKSVYAGVKLYGWLPYADGKERSARDNLAQVLFAIGAYLRTDLNGFLRIEPLWDGTASLIDVDRSYTGGTVKYDAPISAVTVTEHQYVAGTEVKELFSGTAQNGDIITFSEPMHSLSATGFTILESGANYAKISAGTGALTGKAYIHNTRLITQPVTAGAAENVKSVTDATLVSLVNSYAVAKRLADYYRCRETITNDIVSGHEKPGHVVSVYHPYDKKMVSACIQSLDTTMSATLKSSMEALVGFTPAQPESAEYFDERVVLTGSGEWQVPENVTAITAVLIGGAQGGHCGHGGNPATQKTVSITGNIFDIPQYITDKWAFGGKGGKGGDPGFGGKILQATFDVTPAQKFSFACGVGGFGAAFDANNWANTPSTPGADGTKTTFGSLDSSTGSTSEIGYTDPVTGEVFAQKGEQGIAGGDGAGMNPDAVDSKEGKIRLAPLQATSVVDEDGNVWKGGNTRIEEDGTISLSAGDEQSFTGSLEDGFCGGVVSYNCGSGAAAGANGTPGNSSGTFSLVSVPSKGMPKTSITVTATGSASVLGANATLVPKKPTVYGKGGRGGYGGGGDGATGLSETYYGGSKSGSLNNTPGSVRTTGSNGAQGGPGGDGCIILYYRKFGQARSGPLVQKGGGLFFDRLNKLFIV